MLCRRVEVNNGGGSVPVYLNVYDLTSINGYAYWLGLGVYHSGVQVHGVEHAFGAHEYPTTGIFEGKPKQCDGFTFRESILIGWTGLTPGEVRKVMEELAEKYKGTAYNLITKNCNHFCNDACIRLTGNPIPSWVNRLARIGFFCNCVIPASINSSKVRHHRIEDKVCEGEEKKLRSVSNWMEDKVCEGEEKKLGSPSNRSTSCSNSSSSSISSPLTATRSRSRNRNSPPPSSPLVLDSSAT